MKNKKVFTFIVGILIFNLFVVSCDLSKPLYSFAPTDSPTATLTEVQTSPTEPDGIQGTTDSKPIFPTDTPQPSVDQQLGVGSTKVSLINGMTMMYIPAGTFTVGLTDNEVAILMNYCPECTLLDFAASQPAHQVQLTHDYWMYKTEVSNSQYQICVESGTCTLPSKFGSETRNDYFYNKEYANYPVVWVNWDQANTYCHWAGGQLPTDAQWERAARGEDNRLYPWGNNPPNASFANIDNAFGDTTPVDAFQAGSSPYGVLNMVGNVWEWVADWYQPDAYNSSLSIDPKGPSSGLDNYRAGRGGSFWINAGYSTSVTRDWYENYKSGTAVGFRCIVNID